VESAAPTKRPDASTRLAGLLDVRRWGVVALAVAWLVHHCVFWSFRVPRGRLSPPELLNQWDASWYTRIVMDGYDAASFAFFPLYPLLVRGLTTGWRSASTVPVAGAALSLVLFAAFVWLVQRVARDPALVQRGFAPATFFGWALFLYSPASYVFHTHHTESLFLLLSFGALLLAAKERWAAAAILAGLAALTRSQGVILAVTVGALAAAAPGSARLRLGRLALCGGISAALFACYPLYAWATAGDPLAFVSAKFHWSNWARPHTPYDMVRALWLGNEWQNTSFVSLLGAVTFYATLLGAGMLWRRNRGLAAYQLASLLLILTQYELAGANRYSTVLFGALFTLGDTVGRAPRWVQVLLFAGLVVVNHRMVWFYGRGFWAY